ncbi:7105_t:CDS:2 [Paraglomus occultum]|uniref:7105_t:CDS:1 n=1 Tax=Paraglomus occultum TaxID=144539 RepID=A0A9N8ZEE9_9GLOM|nr:7105_t:CDS:2 [Paraglomus occultum]
MPTIKVAYNDEVRQFAVSPHSTWTELSSTLRAIFSIPPSTAISVTYNDEDGDVVTMSSDLELREVFNSHVSDSESMKFTLNIVEESEQDEEDGVVIPNNIRHRNSVGSSRESSVSELGERGWVLEGIDGHEIVVKKDKAEDDLSSCDGEFENIDEDKKSVDIESRLENGGLSQEHTEERAPLLHGLSRAEVDVPSEEEKKDLHDMEIPPSSPPPSASNFNPSLDDLTQQLQFLVNQFQEFFTQNPQIMDTANKLIHDVVESVKGDVETFGEWLKDMKRQIEENILNATDVNVNRNNVRSTSETSQHEYIPTYTPPARSDACRETPFLSGLPGNILSSQSTNNEERSADQAKDELTRQHNHPNLPSSFTAPPPPPPPPPVPQRTTQEEQALPGTLSYVHEIFEKAGPRAGINNGANENTNDNRNYNPFHNSHKLFAYQTPDGQIQCGRGSFGETKFDRSEYPGYSATSFRTVTKYMNNRYSERSETEDSNIQDFALAPIDLLDDIRLLREMGFTQPTRELENLFRRNNNNIDEVVSILVEQADNQH